MKNFIVAKESEIEDSYMDENEAAEYGTVKGYNLQDGYWWFDSYKVIDDKFDDYSDITMIYDDGNIIENLDEYFEIYGDYEGAPKDWDGLIKSYLEEPDYKVIRVHK